MTKASTRHMVVTDAHPSGMRRGVPFNPPKSALRRIGLDEQPDPASAAQEMTQRLAWLKASIPLDLYAQVLDALAERQVKAAEPQGEDLELAQGQHPDKRITGPVRAVEPQDKTGANGNRDPAAPSRRGAEDSFATSSWARAHDYSQGRDSGASTPSTYEARWPTAGRKG